DPIERWREARDCGDVEVVLPRRYYADQYRYQDDGNHSRTPDPMPHGCRAIAQKKRRDACGHEDNAALQSTVGKKNNEVAHRRSFRALSINCEIRSSSSSDRLEASVPINVDTTFSVEPPKNVSMRCFNADCLTA